MYQVTAYSVMDHLQVQLTRTEINKAGYGWIHMISESLPIPAWAEEPWDVAWLLGQLLSSRALERGSEPAGG